MRASDFDRASADLKRGCGRSVLVYKPLSKGAHQRVAASDLAELPCFCWDDQVLDADVDMPFLCG